MLNSAQIDSITIGTIVRCLATGGVESTRVTNNASGYRQTRVST